jgi:succinate dehydrogenase / fumarate reductase, cytochrome b subunit
LASIYAFVGPMYRNAPADLTPQQIQSGTYTPAPPPPAQ